MNPQNKIFDVLGIDLAPYETDNVDYDYYIREILNLFYCPGCRQITDCKEGCKSCKRQNTINDILNHL
jgi:hypothetical protein